MTDEWKRSVLAKLEENAAEKKVPSTKAALAQKLGVDKSGVGNMLLPNDHPKSHRTSGLVDPICDLLKLAPPTIAGNDEDREIVQLLKQITPEQKQAVLTILRTMSGSGGHSSRK